MKNVKNFYYPQSVEEALEMLRDENDKKMIVAGGSSVVFSKDSRVESLVDITRIGLNYIKDEAGFLAIGATTTIQEIFKSPAAASVADGILCKTALNVASRPLRNSITLGGNIVHLMIWSDMPTVLLTLDATIKVQGTSERRIPALDFFKEHPTKIVGKDELVTEVLFPKTIERSGGEYVKFAKTKGDYAIVTIGAYLELEGDECSLARIAVGSASRLPVRCQNAEISLEGKVIDVEMIKKAAVQCREEVKTVTNIWGEAEYKSDLIESLSRRALLTCFEKAKSR